MFSLLGKREIGTKIEIATSENLIEQNNVLFKEIADMIISNEDHLSDSTKEMIKRLQTKHVKVMRLTLELIEFCVQNCGILFHKQMAKQKFLEPYIKLATEKGIHDDIKRDMLGMLSEWTHNMPDEVRSNFEIEFSKLLSKGVIFPNVKNSKKISPHPHNYKPHQQPSQSQPPIGNMYPGQTPYANTYPYTQGPAYPAYPAYPYAYPTQRPPAGGVVYPYAGQAYPGQVYPQYIPQGQVPPNQPAAAPQPSQPPNIETVTNLMNLLLETMRENDPTKENYSQNSLIKEFYDQCVNDQRSIVSYLETCSDDKVIEKLLELNDKLLFAIEKYNQGVKAYGSKKPESSHVYSSSSASLSSSYPAFQPVSQTSAPKSQTNPFVNDLIDLTPPVSYPSSSVSPSSSNPFLTPSYENSQSQSQSQQQPLVSSEEERKVMNELFYQDVDPAQIERDLQQLGINENTQAQIDDGENFDDFLNRMNQPPASSSSSSSQPGPSSSDRKSVV